MFIYVNRCIFLVQKAHNPVFGQAIMSLKYSFYLYQRGLIEIIGDNIIPPSAFDPDESKHMLWIQHVSPTKQRKGQIQLPKLSSDLSHPTVSKRCLRCYHIFSSVNCRQPSFNVCSWVYLFFSYFSHKVQIEPGEGATRTNNVMQMKRSLCIN